MVKLDFTDISVHFGSRQVLRGVNGNFDEGTLSSIIGINGTGKSVLMKSIAGLLPFQGKVNLADGEKRYGAKDIAYVPQMTHAASALTAIEMVLLGRVQNLKWKVDAQTLQDVDEMMEMLSISELANQPFSQLSGGQKQMVVMAQAFMANPKLLLLDEPTSTLDLYHQLRLLDITKEYCAKHRAIAIVVMHDLSLVARYSSRVLLLHEGRSVKIGTPEEVLVPDLLEQIYQVKIDVSKTDSGLTAVVPVKVVDRKSEKA